MSARRALCEQIAFYASTPAYWPVLAHHGLDELGTELHRLSVSKSPDRWRTMGQLVNEDLVDLVAVTGLPEDVARGVSARVEGLWDRISLYEAVAGDPAVIDHVAALIS